VSGHERVGGDRIIAGRYRLTHVIGFGGNGTVWTAIDDVLRREVAIKDVVPPWLGDHERALVRERTLREARAACRIDHPNVVEIYDVVEQDGRLWIVMQLVRAPSLARVIEENGPCEPSQAAWIGLQVLGALRAAHMHGITHRDVKPSNVLVDGEHAVLTDFGIATIDGEATLTTPNTLLGAPSYIAPERIHGAPATAASDLWSLGATLYAAVEGRPPHMREGLIAILTAVVTDEPDPPVNAGALTPVLEALLCKEPAQRPNAAQAESLLWHVLRDTGGGYDAAAADTAIVDETIDSLLQQILSGPRRLTDLHTATDPRQLVDQDTTSDPLRLLDRRVAANSAPAGRSRRFRGLAGAAAIVLLAILLTGMLVRPALLPGSPVYQPPVGPSDNRSTTSTIEPAEQPVPVGNRARPDHSVQPSPARPSPTQPSPVQPSPVQPPPVQPSPTQPPPAQLSPVQPSPTQPAQPPTTQQPEPVPTGTPAPAPTSEPPPSTPQGPSASTAEVSETT
jgi:eukaryotic-like serine/threonine-protein kinase